MELKYNKKEKYIPLHNDLNAWCWDYWNRRFETEDYLSAKYFLKTGEKVGDIWNGDDSDTKWAKRIVKIGELIKNNIEYMGVFLNKNMGTRVLLFRTYGERIIAEIIINDYSNCQDFIDWIWNKEGKWYIDKYFCKADEFEIE